MAALDQDFYDELVAADGQPRAHARTLVEALEALGPEALTAGRPPPRRDLHAAGDHVRRRRARRWYRCATARSRSTSSRGSSPPSEWTTIKRGLAQRIRALNHFVDDVYHAREIIHDGKVPWELVVSRPAFARAAHGIRPPGGVYCHVSGCDLVRDADGAWKVLEDNVRTPSGISYVLENRRAMTRLLPGLFDHYRVRPVDHYPALLRTALEEVAPTGGEEEATVVVWTPGPFNSAYFEHAFLARQMGVELVEASDLVVRDAVCHIRTTRGLQRVHAIYRRIDDDFMDPLEFRPDSVLGVPGLMRAYRAGSVAIVNAVGTGVADDKAIYHYVPEMIRYYLNEEPLLAERADLPDERPRAARVDPRPPARGRGQADQRVRRQGRLHRPARERAGAGRAGGGAQAHAGALDRAGARPALDRADRRPGRRARPAPRRPAPVRGLRREHPHRARAG